VSCVFGKYPTHTGARRGVYTHICNDAVSIIDRKILRCTAARRSVIRFVSCSTIDRARGGGCSLLPLSLSFFQFWEDYRYKWQMIFTVSPSWHAPHSNTTSLRFPATSTRLRMFFRLLREPSDLRWERALFHPPFSFF